MVTESLPGLVADVEVDAGSGFAPALRLTSDVSLGRALAYRRDASSPLELEPLALSLGVNAASVDMIDPRYAGVAPTDRDAFVSTVDDLVLGTFGFVLLKFPLPTCGGFDVGNVVLSHGTATTGDYLLVEGTFELPSSGPSTPAPVPVPTSVTVDPTDVAGVHAALLGASTGLPVVHIALPAMDGMGRSLEYGWRLEGGAWHPYGAAPLVIADRSFAWQGARTIELRARVVGDISTTSSVGSAPVVIDYAPPTIFVDQIVVGVGSITVPARDTISDASKLTRAVSAAGDPAPAPSAFTVGDTVELGALANASDVTVYVRDETGHTATASVHLASTSNSSGSTTSATGVGGGPATSTTGSSSGAGGHTGGSKGCSCSIPPSGSPFAGPLAVLALALAAGARRRVFARR